MAVAQTPVGSASGEGSFATTGSDPFAMGERVAFVGISAGSFGTCGSTFAPPIHGGFDYVFHQDMTLGGEPSIPPYGSRTFGPPDPYGIATIGYPHANWSGPGNDIYSYSVWGPGVGAHLGSVSLAFKL